MSDPGSAPPPDPPEGPPAYPFLIRRPEIRRFGWVPDAPDPRDLMYAAPAPIAVALPASVDLQPLCPPVYDQGQLGSCTGNAIAGALQFARMKQRSANANLVPSRLFIYYGERVIEGTVNADAGASLRDGMKVVATEGDCFESGPNSWPYVIADFAVAPPASCVQAAAANEVKQYSSVVQALSQMKGCLAEGYPFVFGFTAFPALEANPFPASGLLPMPGAGETPIGGHAVMAVGYDDAKQAFKIRNSWGPTWGLQGYFWMPYTYLISPHLAQNFWTVRLV